MGALLGTLSLFGCDDGGGGSPVDGAATDRGAADAARPDGRVPDRGLVDADRPDQHIADAAPPDQGVADAARPDLGVTDAALPDAALPDAALPDQGAPDMGPGPIDLGAPDAAPPPVTAGQPAVVAGAGTMTSARFVLRLSVGGPAPTAVTRSDRLRARLGVALPRPAAQENDR
ncbi:MAG: hypothetical protein H6706_12815 [Myxococcales bacterium]|nr:hypothetical protein [Myxococcales bacterium]